ncbi:helix-turn-helix transcriptional regulator [Actinoallomurus acaciae]|uniref:AAA family ATPase n=1 Tax=Actinoallomurus acaciae TaxID=502577 RepID=A0ABV5Y807_9ACTN
MSPSVDVDDRGLSWRGWRGRDREWSVVTRLLRAAEMGRAGVLLVEGPSGIGKTRLLAEATDAAAARGFMIAQGRGDELRRLVPLAPLMSALGESPGTLGVPERLASSDAGDLRLWLLDQLRTRLEHRLMRGAMLVTLDDLQWADPSTVRALRSLLPDLASYPVVWILARTSGTNDTDLNLLYEVLEQEGANRVALVPLSEDAVIKVTEDILGAAPESDLLTLAERAGGNPFLLVELLDGLSEEAAVELSRGHARLASARQAQLPQRVQTFARTRLERLSSQTRRLLQAAAVLGRSFSVDDLADMLDEPANELLLALEEALTAQIVVPADELLMFRHDLLRQAVMDGLPVSIRRWLHLRAGETLLKHDGSAVMAATHFMVHAKPGDARILAGLDRAAAEVLPSSPQTAAELLTRALELTGRSDPARFDRTVTAVSALTAAGRLSESAELARSALENAPHGQAAGLRHQLALILLMNGRSEEAVVEIEKVLARRDLSDELRDAAELAWFGALILHKDFWQGRRRAETITADPDGHGDDARVGALMLLLHIAWAEGRIADGFGHIRDAVRIALGESSRTHAATPRLFLAAILQCMRHFEEAETVIRAAEEEIEATGQTVHAANIVFVRAYMRLTAGRPDDAAAEAEAGLETAGELGTYGFTRLGHAVLAIVALRRGDLSQAVRHIERYRAQADDNAIPWGWGTWAVALVTEAESGPGRAKQVLGADTRMWRWHLGLEPSLAAWQTRVSLAAGDRALAVAVVDTIEALAQSNPDFPALADAAAHARGILDNDAASLRHAGARLVDPWARASAAEDLGVMLTRGTVEPDYQAAVHSLDRALEGYEKIGALRDAARVRARLRGFGLRRRHWKQSARPVTGWDSLTDTERSVATLVAQGLTNQRVAAQMFVSPHTVKFHLRQVFRKLDIGSRVELANVAAGRRPDTAAPGQGSPRR